MNTRAVLSLVENVAASGTVKWYDSNRGFGFVITPDSDADFLLHQNVLEAFGRKNVADGSLIDFRYQQTPGGMKIVEVFDISPPVTSPGEEFLPEVDCIFPEHVAARVKWFDSAKGYGFVNQFGKTEDIFVGLGVLNKAARKDLQSGEAVRIQVAEKDGRKTVYQIFDWHDD